LKVLFLVHGLPVGGTERVVVDLVRWLRPRGVEAAVGCLDEVGTLGEGLREDGVPVVPLGRRPGFDRALGRRIAGLALDQRADLIHAHQYTPYFYGVLARRRCRLPLLFTEHGRFHPDRPSWKRHLFNRTLGRSVDKVTAVSDGVRRALVRVEGFPGEEIEVLHNGIAPEAFTAPEGARAWLEADHGVPAGAPVVGSVARLNPIKNQALLVDAFADVARALPEARLILVGDGPERAALTARAAAAGLTDRVLLPGEQGDVARWLACMDVFCLTSLSEGMPMTVLEAMAARVPVVCTDVGGIGEMVADGAEGVLVPSGDRGALAAALTRLLKDPARSRDLAERAHGRLLRDFTLDVVGARYVEIYEALTGKAARG
jgi:glycosyltransferase involved in cell wall biosynthesis